MENLEGTHVSPAIEAAATAIRLTEDYPLEAAVANLTDYMYDVDSASATRVVLSIHARYDWPVEAVASVLLAVHWQQHPPEPTIYRQAKSRTTDLPVIGLTLDNGQQVIAGQEYQTVEEPPELRLPDNWDDTQLHTADELDRRVQLIEDVALYFATGVVELSTRRSPIHVVRAAASIKPFQLYARDCEQQKARRQAMEELQWAEVGIAAFDQISLNGLLTALDCRPAERPPVRSLRNIPTRRDAQMIDLESPLATDRLARHDFNARQAVQKEASRLRDRLTLIPGGLSD